MGFTCHLGPLRPIVKQQTAMGDPLDRAISASLRRGLSDELRELADFGLAGHASEMHDYMHIEAGAGGGDMTPITGGLAAQPWPLHSAGGHTAFPGGSNWIPSQFDAAAPGEPMQACEPMLVPAASGSEVAIEGYPPRQMPVVITTYQGRRASWDAGDGSATWQGHNNTQQQQQFGTFGRLSGGTLDSGGGSGGVATSSDSPRGADADERRRMRRRTLNRESAKRARSRQRTQLEEAQAQVLALGAENARLQEAVKRAEAERDAATRQLEAARAQLGAGAAVGRDAKAAAPRSGATSPALTQLNTRSNTVGSSAGSGASEQSSTRLGSVFQLPPQLPPRAPNDLAAAAAKAPYDAWAAPEPAPFEMMPCSEPQREGDAKPYSGKPYTSTGWASMPPPPPLPMQQQPPAIPRIGAPQGRSPPRHATRQRQQQQQQQPQQERHLRSASAPSPATPTISMQWSKPSVKAASQPVPQLSMGGAPSTGARPGYVVSTGIPTPAPPAPPPPRFQVPPQQQRGPGDSAAAGRGASSAGSITISRSGRRSGLRASSPAESPFSDMSDTPFKD